DEDADRHDQQADESQCFGGARTEEPVESFRGERDGGGDEQPGHCPERTSLEGVETEALLHVQVAEDTTREEAEPERDEPDHHGPERPNLLQSSKGRLDRHHILLLVLLEYFAEDGRHLLLSAAGLR